MKIAFISDFIRYYMTFSRLAGVKFLFLLTLIVIEGLFEGIGILLVLPILSESIGATANSNAVVQFLYAALELFGLPTTFNALLVLMVSVFMIKGIVILFQKSLTAYLIATLKKELRWKMIASYIGMRYDYYMNMNIGFLNNIITTEAERAVGAFGHYCMCVVGLIYALIYSATSLAIDWKISLFAIFSGLIIITSLKYLSLISRKYSHLTSEKNAYVQKFLLQIIQFYKYLKTTNCFEKIQQKLGREIGSLAEYEFKLGTATGFLFAIREPVSVLLMASLIFYQVSVMGNGMAGLMVIMMLFYRLITRILTLQEHWQSFNVLTGGIDTYVRTLEDISKNSETCGDLKVAKLNKGIAFKKVSFAFGTTPVLDDVNMMIPKNATIGIVGKSGAGKSTIVDMVTGILRPHKGDLYFDGTPYAVIDLEQMRSNFGFVAQEDVIFHDTIINNVSLWGEVGSDDQVFQKMKLKDVLEKANCNQFLEHMEKGVETVIGDRGVKLSGGQRQRLSIARELYKDPDILILDEATSSLDSLSESLIRQSVEGLKGDKTIIIIAHRLSTIKHCDYIYVMDNGKVIGEGTFEDLYTNNAEFQKMCKVQKL